MSDRRIIDAHSGVQRRQGAEELPFTLEPQPVHWQRLSPREDALRHALMHSFDFSSFRSSGMIGCGGSAAVFLCNAQVPAWCVLGAHADVPPGATEEVEVAVKIMAGVDDPSEPALFRAFSPAFRTQGMIPPHPHIAPVLASFASPLPRVMFDQLPDGYRLLTGGSRNPVMAVVMPRYVRTLQEAVDGTPSPSGEQLVRWSLEVSCAVAHMWRHGWAHLDLKLTAVLEAEDGRAVLCGFSSARHVDEGGRTLSAPARTGLQGNLAHRAPEVLEAWYAAHRASDSETIVRMDAGRQEVWALGVLLHELVAGKHPYGGKYPLVGHDGAPVVDEATLLARGMSAGMVAVVGRMVSRDAGARPADPVAAHHELMATWRAGGGAGSAAEAATT